MRPEPPHSGSSHAFHDTLAAEELRTDDPASLSPPALGSAPRVDTREGRASAGATDAELRASPLGAAEAMPRLGRARGATAGRDATRFAAFCRFARGPEKVARTGFAPSTKLRAQRCMHNTAAHARRQCAFRRPRARLSAARVSALRRVPPARQQHATRPRRRRRGV
jgi:hypothetical protein